MKHGLSLNTDSSKLRVRVMVMEGNEICFDSLKR